MPLYSLVTEDGELLELSMPIAEHDRRFDAEGRITLDDGRTARTNWQAAGAISSCPSNYPMESDAMGVNPTQIQQQMDYDRKLGVPTSYNPRTGAAVYTDSGHRRRHCEAHGFFDRNGSYSDPQRGGRLKYMRDE